MTRSARITLMEDDVIIRTLDIPVLDPRRAVESAVTYDPPGILYSDGVSVQHRGIESVVLTFYPCCNADGVAMTAKEYPRND